MKLNKKELAELIDNIKLNAGDASKLEALMAEIVADEERERQQRRGGQQTVVAVAETINWTPQHEDFKQKIQSLIETQGLEIHPRLRPRLPAWIDAAINRDYKCVMDRVRGCPCEEPAKWGCPLLHKL